MHAVVILLIKIAGAVAAGIIAGNGAVYAFNHTPASWFAPYGEDPCRDAVSSDRQRIPGYPWKYVSSVVFCIVYVFIVSRETPQYAVPAAAALFILALMAMSCGKYRVVPDQFTVLLFVCGFGFIPFHSTWKMIVIGAAAGLGASAVVFLIVKYALKRDTGSAMYNDEYGYLPGRHRDSSLKAPLMGAAEIPAGAAIGLMTGPYGALAVVAGGACASAVVTLFLTRTGRDRKGDAQPLTTYICAAAALYIALHIRVLGF
ncbi:MAG: hypothetical protein ACOYJH_00215 [Anaerovoracaceae bacterium]|jgi:prepilin signal peptidase PulO-like enzyme (type II secretory pathway)